MAMTLNVHLKNGSIEDKATTQRTNFPFNSFCNFNGQSLAAGPTGLMMLGGNKDNGVNIDAYFAPIITDFGEAFSKRMRYMDISYTSSGRLYIKAGPDSGQQITYMFTGNQDNLQRVKLKLGERDKGVYWAFEFGNTNGCDFGFNRISVRPTLIQYGNKNF